jgi:hypothetical protein
MCEQISIRALDKAPGHSFIQRPCGHSIALCNTEIRHPTVDHRSRALVAKIAGNLSFACDQGQQSRSVMYDSLLGSAEVSARPPMAMVS